MPICIILHSNIIICEWKSEIDKSIVQLKTIVLNMNAMAAFVHVFRFVQWSIGSLAANSFHLLIETPTITVQWSHFGGHDKRGNLSLSKMLTKPDYSFLIKAWFTFIFFLNEAPLHTWCKLKETFPLPISLKSPNSHSHTLSC